ncbi:MAG: putative PurR-regulated permease PerM [Candidatus Azotimanducaceae bacterium]|jgi:predicted PurR-regulated permease PerM
MFVSALRGSLETLITIQLHFLSVVLMVITFGLPILGLQYAALAAFLAGSYFILAHMGRN